jgi:hypothetical protein
MYIYCTLRNLNTSIPTVRTVDEEVLSGNTHYHGCNSETDGAKKLSMRYLEVVLQFNNLPKIIVIVYCDR